MSKIVRHYCDVCGRELDEEKDLIELDLFDYFLHREGTTTIIADLCDDCLASLEEDIIKMLIGLKGRKHESC